MGVFMDSESDEDRSDGFIDIVNRIQTAVAELAQKLRPHIRAKAGKRLGAQTAGIADASDVTQDAEMAICRNIGAFRGSTEWEFLAWVNTILQNKIWDAQGGPHPPMQAFQTDSDGEIAIAADTKSPSSKAAAREEESRLRAALLELSADDQAIIQLRYFERKGWDDIAKHTQVGVVALKGRYHRAIRRWKEKLGESP